MGDIVTSEAIKPELKKYQVSNKEFVLAWQQARSLPELVTALGMQDGKHARQKVNNRADMLRGQGVRLKKLRKSHALTRDEVVELNHIIENGGSNTGWFKTLTDKAKQLLRG